MKRVVAILLLMFMLIELMAVAPVGVCLHSEMQFAHDSVGFRVKKDDGKAVHGNHKVGLHARESQEARDGELENGACC